MILILGFKNQTNESGLEIYILNISHPVLTNKNPEECYCCVDVKKKNLSIIPLIYDSEIEFFDFEKQKLILTKSGQKKLNDLNFSKTGVYGIPAAIVLNGKPIYSFMFFPIGSSVACDRPFTHLNIDKKEFYIHFGVGKGKNEFRYGEDPRFDENLKKYIDNRFKNN